MFKRKRSQTEVFDSFGWWHKSCFLNQITGDRCDYIESCITRVYGENALAQQEILEIGCGGGLICEQLAARKAIMVGIDPSERALAEAREHTLQSGFGQNVYYQQGYAEDLPYADGSFSVIVSLDVLEHVRDLAMTIREVARVLAPGGIFVFDTINRTLLARAILIWFGENFASGGMVPGLHSYTGFIRPAELRHHLLRSNLRVHEMTGFLPVGWSDGHVKMGPGGPMTVSYVGYATKNL